METDKRIIEPLEGFAREIGFYLSQWEKSRAELREIVADLSQDELTARLTPEAHQIGNLILHLGEAEASWIHSIVTGRDLTEEEKRISHWCDTTERDYAEKDYTAAECLERIDRISETSRQILKEFSDRDLERLINYERPGRRVEVTLRWVLCHVIDHEAHHKGQIALLKRLMRGGKSR